MLKEIEVLYHSSIRIKKDLTIYFDPFKINKEYHDADIIFITHSHYDHYSEEDINKIKQKKTIIIAPSDLYNKLLLLGFEKSKILIVKPNESYYINNIKFKTIPAYNIDKQYHPKNNNWVGYLLTIDSVTYYIAGDTDITKENKEIKCDIALIPIGGTYTMDCQEAAKLINIIKPKVAIPTHYNSIIGTITDGYNFAKMLDKNIKCELYQK